MRTKSVTEKILIFLFTALISGMAAGCNSEYGTASKAEVDLAEAVFPEDTSVLIRANTITDSSLAGLTRRSEFYYYDQQGTLLQAATADEEQFGSCMLFRDNQACFFLRNRTIVQSASEKTVLFSDYDESESIKGARFGVSKCGYIDSTGELYALRNVGQKSPDVPYINTIRITNGQKSYDVVIPYYLDDICYDPVNSRFVCPISSLNNMAEHEYVDCAVVTYREEEGKYCLEEQLLHFSNESLQERGDIYAMGFRAEGDNLFQFTVTLDDPMDPSGFGSLICSIYSIEKQEVLNNITAASEMEMGPYGGVMEPGWSSVVPTAESEGKLYFFSWGNRIYVQSEDGIREMELPFSFNNFRSVEAPMTQSKKNGKETIGFRDMLIKFMGDGKLYLLGVNDNGKMQVFRLEDDSSYSLFWEAELPKVFSSNLALGDFEVTGLY